MSHSQKSSRSMGKGYIKREINFLFFCFDIMGDLTKKRKCDIISQQKHRGEHENTQSQ